MLYKEISALVFLMGFLDFSSAQGVFVDPGNPYSDGPLMTGEMTLSVTTDHSPKHSKVYFPLEKGQYAPIYFVGGFRTLAMTEFYSTYLKKVASHGFFVFGVDYDYPFTTEEEGKQGVGQSIEIYFKQLSFFQTYIVNKTVGIPRWDDTGLLCHSAGCDITLKMIQDNRFKFTSGVFLEPVSYLVREPVQILIPALMYGTELSEEGPTHCCIKGIDYKQFYDVWKCPRVMVEVASFGHCDILDELPWEACHDSHFCTTTNDTMLGQYRQFAQGATASFFITMLQGRPDAISYIADQSKAPLRLLQDLSDLQC